jgi:hypothetical protein
MWKIWCKALGEKASHKNNEADKVAVVRSIIFITYLVTNCFIVAGVIRHWNDREINVEVQVYENPESSQNTYPKRWNDLGVGRDARTQGIYQSTELYSE